MRTLVVILLSALLVGCTLFSRAPVQRQPAAIPPAAEPVATAPAPAGPPNDILPGAPPDRSVDRTPLEPGSAPASGPRRR